MIPKRHIKSIKTAILVNKNKIIQEIVETKSLYNLILKWGSEGSLSKEEMSQVKKQLLDILKTIPAITIFLIPFGSIILVLLVKTLPFDILPSAFSNSEKKALDE